VIAAIRGLLSMPKFKAIPLMDQNRGVFGVNMGHLWGEAAALGNMLREILELVRQGMLDPVVDTTFPFARAGEAHAHIQGRGNFGKVLLVP
jgi:NADPH:quinone reductase-like Zn-dependent oxidoreductase